MKLYNLFPLLAGPFDHWTPHLERAAAMGFDWIFVNPIQQLGRSGSLYSIADYFAINKALLSPDSNLEPDAQVQAMAEIAGEQGLSLMIDLVINHCAEDSPLVTDHPDWFVRHHNRIAHPFCVEANGNKVVWRDLAQFDHQRALQQADDPDGLLAYFVRLVEHLIGLGFRGFRCDAAYQLPAALWEQLITQIRDRHPDTLFVAETLGCSPEQTRETAGAGFDAIFNSAKWWDFNGNWLLDQYELTRQIAPSIGFPESHDTPRMYEEFHQNADALRQRYLFTALFASGVMIPMGFEFGFRRRLDVVETTADDWETPNLDLTDFIRQVNAIKDAVPVLDGEGRIERLDHPDPAVLVLRKHADDGQGQALLIINKDPWARQRFYCDDLRHLIQSPGPIRDLSPDWPMAELPAPFEFWLGPGMARVLVSSNA
ncbi:MAG: alpha-amylase family glycosyl hydrolase [Lamprobacter sp.]|uniref:alpha-amylase family glycosyl hydrolase n=1 Tax=Lamprobacter sp. TaxID=3100796 RepID=UPI002B256E90|nr:alpha-amylase family glycosyl hydrolase [Lamprobacter sp.]MEA3640335.1 alpha-amylase family glycosyl hydrolase [Lamprobacter sp.]